MADEGHFKIKSSTLVWLIWSVAASFYFFEICLRMLPGIMTEHYMHHFHIDAMQLGVFTALYYWAYTIMQIPAGLIVDRFNVRTILLFALSICLCGFVMVHSTASLHVAEAGRFIIGLGSAFAYVGCLKVASQWLPTNRFATASCILDSIGMVGALFTTTVLLQINVHFGVTCCLVFLIITGIILLIFIAIFLHQGKRFVKIKRRQISRSKTSTADSLKNVMKSKQLWLLGLVGCLSYLPSSVIGDVWGLPYLQTVYHFDKSHASFIMGTFFIAWGISGPFLGRYSDSRNSRAKPLIISLLFLLFSLCIIVYYPAIVHHGLPFWAAMIVFMIMGAAAGAHPLVFTMAKELFNNKLAGTVIATTNMMVMVGGLIFQPLIGYMLDTSKALHRASMYSPQDFIKAFSTIPICILLAIFAMAFVIKAKKKSSLFVMLSDYRNEFNLRLQTIGESFGSNIH